MEHDRMRQDKTEPGDDRARAPILVWNQTALTEPLVLYPVLFDDSVLKNVVPNCPVKSISPA